MKHPRGLNDAPIPYESRTVLALRRRHENIQLDRRQVEIARETNVDLPPPPSTFQGILPGDEDRLRGIPVVGVKGGYGGAIRGTTP